MPVSKKKLSRMVSFRLSPDEYSVAAKFCQEQGHRSVSALARASTLNVLPSFAAKPIIDPEDFFEMQDQINSLRNELARISRMFPPQPSSIATANSGA